MGTRSKDGLLHGLICQTLGLSSGFSGQWVFSPVDAHQRLCSSVASLFNASIGTAWVAWDITCI